MTLTLTVHVHLHHDCSPRLQADVTELLHLVRRILKIEEHEMALIDDLATDVTDLTTVTDSAVTLLGNLSAQLAAAGTDPVKLQAIKDTLDQSKDKLAAAIVANTPAA